MLFCSVPVNWFSKCLFDPLGEGNGTPLQYSCLENPTDRGAWRAAVHGVAEGRTRLSDFTFTFHFPALEKEMATHSSVLAWRIPETGEPGGLPSMGLHRVGHDWSDLAAAAAYPITNLLVYRVWYFHKKQLDPLKSYQQIIRIPLSFVLYTNMLPFTVYWKKFKKSCFFYCLRCHDTHSLI